MLSYIASNPMEDLIKDVCEELNITILSKIGEIDFLQYIKETKVTWILLDWKLKVINRPTYGQVLTVNTWGKGMNKFFTYRDYEIYDNNNN